jgi:hypothetical protein
MTGIQTFQCCIERAKFCGFMLVHGEFIFPLRQGLGPVFKAAHVVFCGHVRARDQAPTLLGDALQQFAALFQEAIDVVAVLNALRVSWNPGALTDYHDRD